MKCYSVKHKNKQVQVASSSGGAFTALSDVIFSRAGKVIGGGYNYSLHIVEPMVCGTPEERDRLRGSKYIQSDLKNIFRQIKAVAEQNVGLQKPVLFVGTPCQVAGLKSYLLASGTDIRNIYMCDIICHGVPSPGLWKEYIRNLLADKKLEHVTFKDKRLGWKQPTAFAVVDGKEKSLRPYTLLYFGELISRPSCSRCPYASVERISDITIGDHWSVQNVDLEFYSRDGISLVFINTDKGLDLFREASDAIEFRERSVKECIQPNLQKPTPEHAKRWSFWRMYHRNPKAAICWFDLVIAAKKIKQRVLR